jgi:hypothetical protein
MTAPAFTTRAEAAAPPKHLVEVMSEAAYTATKAPSFPGWPDVGQSYRDDMHRSMVAAIRAAEAAGYRVRGLGSSRSQPRGDAPKGGTGQPASSLGGEG